MARPDPTRARRLLGGVETLLAIAVVAGFGGFVYLVAEGRTIEPERSLPPVAQVSPMPVLTSAPSVGPLRPATAGPPVSAQPAPTADPEPSREPTPEPTQVPTAKPTTKPTVKPTAKPTTKPTAKPAPDPEPEGTPKITTAKGSFGQTLTVQGITVTMSRREPVPGLANCLVEDDPEKQGWTEAVAYDLTMTWPSATSAEEPWIAVGASPYNVLWFDGPSPFKSGADYIFATCHRPGDSYKAKVEISPPGSPIIYYRWYFS